MFGENCVEGVKISLLLAAVASYCDIRALPILVSQSSSLYENGRYSDGIFSIFRCDKKYNRGSNLE